MSAAAAVPALPGFGPYLSPEGRRRWTVRALAVVLLVLEVEVLWDLVGIVTVGELVTVPGDGWFEAHDRITIAFQVVRPMLLAAAAVAFVAWQRRVIRNTLFLGCERPDPGPTLATFGWFVPFLNLVLPYLSLRQVAVWSRPPGTRGGPLLGFWWGAWLLSGAVELVGSGLTALDRGPTLWIAGSAVRAAGTLLLLASGVLALRVVNAVSRGQEARVAALANPSGLPAAIPPVPVPLPVPDGLVLHRAFPGDPIHATLPP